MPIGPGKMAIPPRGRGPRTAALWFVILPLAWAWLIGLNARLAPGGLTGPLGRSPGPDRDDGRDERHARDGRRDEDAGHARDGRRDEEAGHARDGDEGRARERTGNSDRGGAPDRRRDGDQGAVRPGWYGGVALAIAVVSAGLAIFLYGRFNQWHGAAQFTASTQDLGSGPEVSLTAGSGSGVSWDVTSSSLRQLTVQGPGPGWAEITLPLPASSCPAVAERLGVKCGPGGLLRLTPPVTFGWSNAVNAFNPNGDQTASEVNVDSVATAHGGLDAVLSATTYGQPNLCFTVLAQTTLTITGGARPYSHAFTGPQAIPCGQGVDVLVGSAGEDADAPPWFQFGDIDSLVLTTTGPAATLQGFSDPVMLTPGGESVPGSLATVSVKATRAAGVAGDLSIGPAGRSLTVTDKAAASVVTSDGGELVPSYWTSANGIIAPLLGAGVTVFVITPLGLALGVLTDALKHWQGPFRGRRKQKEVRR